MIIFYGFIFVTALISMLAFSSGIFLCIVTMLAAAGGIVCELLLQGKWKKLSGLLVIVCVTFCLLTGRSAKTSVAQDYQTAVQDIIEAVDDGDLDEAKANLESLDEGYGITDTSRYAWTYLYMNVNDFGKAREFMYQAEDQHCKAWYARMEEVYLCEATPEAQAALMDLYVQAAEELPEDAHMQLMAGLVYMDRYDNARAKYHLQRAFWLDEESTEAPYYLGTLYFDMGDYETARYHFGEALLRGADEEMQSYIKWYVLEMEAAA